MSFQHGKYVRALYAEHGSCILMPITEVFGLLVVILLYSPHDAGEVGGDVARDVAGDAGVFHFHVPDTRKPNAMFCAALQSVDEIQ